MSTRRRTILSAAIVALLLGLTFATAILTSRQLAEREQAQVGRGADAATASIEARLRAYIEVLYGARGLFATSDRVSHADFHRFVDGLRLDERYPGIQVLGVALPVPEGSRAATTRAIEADIRASGLPYPTFAIHPVRAGRAYPIAYIEPQASNAPALGLDFGVRTSSAGRWRCCSRPACASCTSATARPTARLRGPGRWVAGWSCSDAGPTERSSRSTSR
jgi:CHASE1-domain containing sensor protein